MTETISNDNSVQGKTVLLATDGKPHSEKAIKYAIDFSKLTSSKLYVIYVVNPKTDADKHEMIKEGMKRLQDIKDRAIEHGVDTTTLLEGGNPYQGIIAASERIKAGAIIVGTSGKTALDRVLIGSVSEYVVRNSSCTVIVVK